MPTTEIQGRRVGYRVHGEQGPPLLLLSGYGVTKDEWWPEHIDLMARHHRVVLMDNRGVGESSVTDEPYSLLDLAGDAVALLDVVGLDTVHLFGASMGGMVAEQMVLTHRQRVRSLMLASTAFGAFGQPHVVPPALDVVMAVRKPASGDREADLRERMWIGYPKSFIDANPDFVDRLIADRTAYPEPDPTALDLQFRAVLETHDTEAQLPQISCPTLVLAGTEDLLIPAENGRRMVGLIPDARLIEYPDCGHSFLEQTGTQAVEDILRFVAEIEAAR